MSSQQVNQTQERKTPEPQDLVELSHESNNENEEEDKTDILVEEADLEASGHQQNEHNGDILLNVSRRNSQVEEKTLSTAGRHWFCDCGAVNENGASTCRVCLSIRYQNEFVDDNVDVASSNWWLCECGARCGEFLGRCIMCNRRKKSNEIIYRPDGSIVMGNGNLRPIEEEQLEREQNLLNLPYYHDQLNWDFHQLPPSPPLQQRLHFDDNNDNNNNDNNPRSATPPPHVNMYLTPLDQNRHNRDIRVEQNERRQHEELERSRNRRENNRRLQNDLSIRRSNAELSQNVGNRQNQINDHLQNERIRNQIRDPRTETSSSSLRLHPFITRPRNLPPSPPPLTPIRTNTIGQPEEKKDETIPLLLSTTSALKYHNHNLAQEVALKNDIVRTQNESMHLIYGLSNDNRNLKEQMGMLKKQLHEKKENENILQGEVNHLKAELKALKKKCCDFENRAICQICCVHPRNRRLSCGHTLCDVCSSTIGTNNPVCPFCRRTFHAILPIVL